MLLLEAGKTVEAMKLVEFIPFIGLRARIFVAVAKRKAEAGEPMEASALLTRALEPTGQEPEPATLSDGLEWVIDAQLAFGAAEDTTALFDRLAHLNNGIARAVTRMHSFHPLARDEALPRDTAETK